MICVFSSLFFRRRLAAICFGLCALSLAQASEPSPMPQPQRFTDATNAARRVTVLGPAPVRLAQRVVFQLPEGLDYIPEPEAGLLLQASGQAADPSLLGLIQPHRHGLWLITLHYDPIGYFAHGADAPDWPHRELLKELQRTAVARNHARSDTLHNSATSTSTSNQFLMSLVDDEWLQAPVLDTKNHRVAWGIALHGVTSESETPKDIAAYAIHLLGRQGVISLRLIGPRATHTFDKERLHALLSTMRFLPGQRYEDFDPQHDAIATVSLNALITGLPSPSAASTTASSPQAASAPATEAPTQWLGPTAWILLLLAAIAAVLALKQAASMQREAKR
jgi:uncharacterized membrane-anchored protein